MRRLTILLTIFALCSVAPRSDASIVPFDISIALQSGGSVSGVVDVDTVRGVFTGANFTVVSGGLDYIFNFAPQYQGFGYGTMYYYGDWREDSNGNPVSTFAAWEFQLALPINSLRGFVGSPICSTSSECTVPGGYLPTGFYIYDPSQDLAVSGSVVPAAPTPEPGSFLLLTSAALGMTIAQRKRLQRPSTLA